MNDGNGAATTPELIFTEGETYIFDQSHRSNEDEHLVFGYTIDDSLNIIETDSSQNIIGMGTPGQSGAYTQVKFNVLPTSTVYYYYYSINTQVMGNGTTEITPSLTEVLPGDTLEFTIKNRSGLPILYTISGPITYGDLSLNSDTDMSGYIQPGLHSLSFDIVSTPNADVDFIFSNDNLASETRTINF